MRYLVPVHNTSDAAVSDGTVAEAPATIATEANPAEVATEQALETETEAAKAEVSNKKPWFLERISQESAKAQEAAARAAAAERRAAEAEALAARLQAGKETERAPVPKDETEFQAKVREEAERMRFYDDTVSIKNAGLSKYGAAFNESLSVLNAVGATNNDFIADVMAVDKADAHVLLDRLAKDPEKAVALASMNSRQRIAELTRMTVTAAAAKTDEPAARPAVASKTVSKAPAPAPRVEGSASKVVDWRTDAASDKEFDEGFVEMMKRRNARR